MINGKSHLSEIVRSRLEKEFGSVDKAAEKMLFEAKNSKGLYSERVFDGVRVIRTYGRPNLWSSFTVSVKGVGILHKYSVSAKYLNRPTAFDQNDCLFQ